MNEGAEYFEQIRQPEERIIYKARFHWFYDVLFQIYVGLAIIAFFALYVDVAGWRPFLDHFLVIMGVSCVLLAADNRATKWSTHVMVSDRRIIYKTGLVSRRMEEIAARRIAEVNVAQSVMGRMLDYGTIRINDVGSGAIQLPNLDDPLSLKKAIDTIALKGAEK